MTASLTIAGETVAAGQRRTIDIAVAHLYTHTAMTIPVHVVRGRRDGPHLFVSAAIHGDEIVGVEIIRRLLKLKALQRLRGTLLAVPVVNVYGFVHSSRYLPDRRDLNRFFPGSDKGSLTSRLAAIFMQEIVRHSTHGIDLHSGSNHRINLPQVRASLDDVQTRQLALAFGAPVVLDADLRDGSLRAAVQARGIPMLLYEAGEALRFDEISIRSGLQGILSVMRAIGMLSNRGVRPRKIQPLVASSTSWVRAPASGIFNTRTRLGTRVSTGRRIGEIADPSGEHETDVLCPVSGIVIGRLNLPLVHKGDALFHVAGFENADHLKETLDDFREEYAQARQQGL